MKVARSIVRTDVADADGLEEAAHRFAHRGVGRQRREIAGIEAVREAGLDQELLGPPGVERERFHLERELELGRHEGAPGLAEAEHLRLVDSRCGRSRGSRPCRTRRSVPRGLRVPLVQEVEPVDAVEQRGDDADAGRALEIGGDGPAEEIGQIHLAGLHRGGARGLVGDRAHHEPLHLRSLAPVVGEGVERQLDAGSERGELERARPHRRLLVGFLAHPLDVLLGHDPARPGGGGAVRRR